jgi:hypothetical protein
VENLHNTDLFFIGAPCHHATLAKPMLKFLSSLPDTLSCKFAGFYTHSTVLSENSERNKQLIQDWAGKCLKVFEKTAIEKNLSF